MAPDATHWAQIVAPFGLNLVGVAAVSDYDTAVAPEAMLSARFPGVRSVLVLGHGGRGFWDAYVRAVQERRARGSGADPLDAYTREIVTAALAPLRATGARLVFPFDFPDRPVSFMRLAACAGLGRPSRVGVLLHPTFGPWIALRAAALSSEVWEPTGPGPGGDPCADCVEQACVAACPAQAVGAAGWNVPRCAAHRGRLDDPCAARCHARFECVVGREHRYPETALAHHQAHARAGLLATRR